MEGGDTGGVRGGAEPARGPDHTTKCQEKGKKKRKF